MKKVILHTEASLGWGGQERRIVKEAEGMRERGHEVMLAAPPHSKIFLHMQSKGFKVFPVFFEKKYFFSCLAKLLYIFKKFKVEIVNTHSSNDAWIAGISARIAGKKIVRTRHLSSPVRAGLNSRLLYNKLADQVVTTCEETAVMIKHQANLEDGRCCCIATGTDPSKVFGNGPEFRRQHGISMDDKLVGTVCVLRSWKGIYDLIQAALILKDEPHLKWLIVGDGPQESLRRQEVKDLGLEDKVFFTGHLESPFDAMAALDIFTLLSTANEGISQSSLQAAFLEKPLITTPTGGLKEVCLDGKTGYIVPCKAPQEIAKAVKKMLSDPQEMNKMGKRAKALVLEKFTMQATIESMLNVYNKLG